MLTSANKRSASHLLTKLLPSAGKLLLTLSGRDRPFAFKSPTSTRKSITRPAPLSTLNLCLLLTAPLVTALIAPSTALANGTGQPQDYLHIEQQIEVGELNEAQARLQQSISQLQRTGDRYDGQLVQPLRLLGRVFHEKGDYPRAAETLALATQISRVSNGLHSVEQLQLVHEEIRSLKAMGNIVEANRRHEYAFSIARRHFGKYGEQLVPELLKIGVWYTSTGDVIGARDRFAEARVLLSANPETADSDEMLFALKGIAQSYRDEAFPPFFSRTTKETEDLYRRNGLTDRQAGIREDMAMRASLNSFHRGSEALIDVVRIEANRLADIQRKMRADEIDETDPMDETSASPSNTDSGDQAAATETASETAEQADTGQIAKADTDSDNANDRGARDELVKTTPRSRTTTVALDELESVIENPEVDKAPFINSLLALGDWYLLMNKQARAFGYYQHAYRVAERDPNTDPVALLGEPSLLYFPRPRDPRLPEMAPKESFEQGYVKLQFDVDHRGDIKRLQTLETHPKGMMEFNVRSSARVARYRPRIIDGLPQPAVAQTYQHKFEYFPRGRETTPPKVIDTDTSNTSNAPNIPNTPRATENVGQASSGR